MKKFYFFKKGRSQGSPKYKDAGEGKPITRDDSNKLPVDLIVYHQNVRGLRTKLNDLYACVHSEDFPVIVLSKIWLHGGISNGEFLDNRYSVFKKDRANLSGDKTRCGSVFVGNFNIILGACYIPPGPYITIYSDHVNLTNNINKENPNP